MKTIKILLILSAVVFTGNALAAGDDEKQRCKKPKFYKFDPSLKKGAVEVAPGSEFSFHASGWVVPGTIEVQVKKIKTEVTVENRNIFYIFRGKLPSSLKDTFARISISGQAKLGCKNKSGWLVKITGGEESTDEAEEAVESETKEEVKAVDE